MNTSETVIVKPHGLRILEAAPVTWDSKVSKLSMSDRQELERTLSDLCQRAARLIGYLEARGTTGCGDGGHADGVKESNRRVAKVRKALGYTQAKHDLRF